MRKLSTRQEAERDEIGAELEEAEKALEDEVSSFNEDVKRMFEDRVQPLLDKVNAARDRARSLRDDVVAQMEDYAGERSERWAESDAGQAYEEWKDRWEGLDLEDAEMEDPSELDAPDAAAREFLDADAEVAS